MKKLEKTFTKKGFTYTQHKRVGMRAIYVQRRVEADAQQEWYEVIVIKSHNGYEIAGNNIPASEIYPSSTQWGSLGWTFSSLQDAEKKFAALKE